MVAKDTIKVYRKTLDDDEMRYIQIIALIFLTGAITEVTAIEDSLINSITGVLEPLKIELQKEIKIYYEEKIRTTNLRKDRFIDHRGGGLPDFIYAYNDDFDDNHIAD